MGEKMNRNVRPIVIHLDPISSGPPALRGWFATAWRMQKGVEPDRKPRKSLVSVGIGRRPLLAVQRALFKLKVKGYGGFI